MKKLLFILLLSFPLFSAELVLKDGYVAAHTEMLIDSTIDPINNSLQADITMDGSDIMTLRGKFWVEMNLFTSDKGNRDEDMYEELEIGEFKIAIFNIANIIKSDSFDNYIIEGMLDFHGIKKELSAMAQITVTDNGSVVIEATSKILMSDFGIEMPCLVFMCVRDRVDLIIKASF